MTPLRIAVVDRLNQLTAVLMDLKERVRAAVASEVGKAVGDAVRDLVSAIVRHRPSAPVEREPRVFHPYLDRSRPHDPWDEEDDGRPESWDADDSDPRRCRSNDEGGSEYCPTSEPPPRSGWASALTLGAGVVRWVVAHRGPPWVGALAGGLVLASSFAGGPVLRAIADIVHVAAELVHLGRLTPPVF